MKVTNRTVLFARILGPTLLMLSVTEWINLEIWATNQAALTYFNGLFLLVSGLTIVVSHNFWKGWPVVITVLGWVIVLSGAYRMFFPQAEQANEGLLPYLFFIIMGLSGLLLTFQGFRSKLS